MVTDAVLLAVNGTLMRGLELSPNMVDAGACFVEEAATAPCYRLWSVNDAHPAMQRVSDGAGASVACELWLVPPSGLGRILEKEPPGLCVGKVVLDDGRVVLGVLGEAFLVEGQKDITAFAGWRAYTAAAAARPCPPPAACVAEVAAARPRPFRFPPASTALLMIDFQRDFYEPGGFGATLGNDVGQLSCALAPAAALLAAARAAGLFVVHTQEAHKPDLSDLHASKAARGAPRPGQRIGDVASPSMGRLLVRGEPGNALLPSLAAADGELCVYKCGKGAFYATRLGATLSSRGITHLLVAGVTTEVCVSTTMREANDRGMECCLVEEATASYFPDFKEATLRQIVAQGGIIGWVARLGDVVAALGGAAKPE